MQRIKDDGKDPSKPVFGDLSSSPVFKTETTKPLPEISMTKPGVDRKITVEELEAHNKSDQPWFVVRGEVRWF